MIPDTLVPGRRGGCYGTGHGLCLLALRTATPLFLIAAGMLWAWHLPQAYDAAMANIGLYWVMQAALLGKACLIRLVPREEPLRANLGRPNEMSHGRFLGGQARS